MIKKRNGLFICIALLLWLPSQASASGMSDWYNPPSNSDFHQKKISWELYVSPGIEKVRITQFSYGLPKTVIDTVTWNVKPNSTIWVDMTCKGDTSFEFLDASGTVKQTETRGQTESYLNNGSCGSGSVKPSDYNKEKNQYASDTFGGTKSKLSSPSTPDGSGGTGSTGFEGVDDGSGGSDPGGDDGGGTDPGGEDPGGSDPGGDDGSGGGSGEDCGECAVFDCPGWDEYMGKIDDIAGKIPPPPNWPVVADTFRDSIVPKLINDLDNLLGDAPAPPPAPPEVPALDDRGLSNQTPSMPNLPDLPQFDSDDIKNGAPTIPEREDPTGGFDLTDNPMDTLPEAPTNPIPGQTDPGEWGKNKPKEESNPFPFPKDQGEPEIGSPPKPGDNGATPPTPGGEPGSAPIPGGDYGAPPTTGGDTPPMKDYKPSPGSPDGSGGDIYP